MKLENIVVMVIVSVVTSLFVLPLVAKMTSK